eukprot:TRINITY_DN207_c0_g1_i1.p1 TRINITY_DN207_c0_g1~~TRINITY_DN207_c0_g1_i1.p1  ORF type:complete len:303 (-),score=109.98 TRINITY_DN207_c0_g1_i1:195-1103(-)
MSTSQNKIKIQVTNDDGYEAIGIQAIAKNLGELGFEVKIIAPATEQSGKSASITAFQPLFVEPVPQAQIPTWKVFGTPVDCVKCAIKSPLLSPWIPDLIVSGINRGANYGQLIYYSGTVGAAREANLCGIPAFALSLIAHETLPIENAEIENEENKKANRFHSTDQHYHIAASYFSSFILNFAPQIIQNKSLFSNVIFNLNLRASQLHNFKGWKLCKPTIFPTSEFFAPITNDLENRLKFRLGWKDIGFCQQQLDENNVDKRSEFQAITDLYGSIVLLWLDFCKNSQRREIKSSTKTIIASL